MKLLKTKWVRWVAGGFAAVVTLLGVLVLFLLVGGPVSLNFLTPRLEAMLNEGIKDFRLRFDDTTLAWSDGGSRITIALTNVAILDKAQKVLANAPKVEMAISASALIEGKVVPKRISLVSPKAMVVRNAAGQMQLNLSPGALASDAVAAEGGVKKPDQDFFAMILSAMQGEGSEENLMRHLESFSIEKGDFTFRDDVTQTTWHAPASSLTLTRQDGALKGELDVSVLLGQNRTWRINGWASVVKGRKDIDVAVNFADVRLSEFAHTGRGLEFLAQTHVPVRGDVRFTVLNGGAIGPIKMDLMTKPGTVTPDDPKYKPMQTGAAEFTLAYDPQTGLGAIEKGQAGGAIVGGSFAWADDIVTGNKVLKLDIQSQAMSFDWPEMFDRRLMLDRAGFKGTVDPANQLFTFEDMTLRRGAFEIHVNGSVQLSAVSPAVQMAGTFNNLTIQDLKSVWPRFAAPNAHYWVTERMHEGVLKNGTIRIALAADTIVDGFVPDEGVEIRYDFEGLRATYLDGMTDLSNGRGWALLKGDTFEAVAQSANSGPLKLSNGRVYIPTLHIKGTVAEIGGDISGTMTELLRELDQPRLGYPSKFGIKPESVGGVGAFRAAFKVPTLKDLDMESVDISINGRTEQLALALGRKIRLAAGNLDLQLTQSGLTAKGDAKVNDVNMIVRWTENFRAGNNPSSEYAFEGTFGEAERLKLGFNFDPYVDGAINAVVVFNGRGANIRQGKLNVSLEKAKLHVQELNWSKPQGVAFNGRADVTLAPDGVFIFDDLKAEGPGIEVAGQVVVNERGIREAHMSRLKLGPRNDFSVIAKMPEKGEHTIVISGRLIDAAGVMGDDASHAKAKDGAPKIARAISAKVATAMLKGDAALNNVDFQYQTDGERLRAFALNATTLSGAPVQGDLKTAPDGTRKFTLRSGDAGQFINGLSGLTSVIAGQMTLVADLDAIPTGGLGAAPSPGIPSAAAALGADSPAHFSGALKLENFKVVDQPFLARLFAAGSFGGLGDLLQGDGITFTKLEHSFQGVGERLTIVDGRANGPSIGVTFQGKIDRSKDKVDMVGTLVPIYGLNSMFEDIPIVGDLLTSRKGEGILGMTYEVAGDVDDMSVMVNPLSMVTPGIFRRIFQVGQYPQDVAPAAVPAAPKPPASAFGTPAQP